MTHTRYIPLYVSLGCLIILAGIMAFSRQSQGISPGALAAEYRKVMPLASFHLEDERQQDASGSGENARPATVTYTYRLPNSADISQTAEQVRTTLKDAGYTLEDWKGAIHADNKKIIIYVNFYNLNDTTKANIQVRASS